MFRIRKRVLIPLKVENIRLGAGWSLVKFTELTKS